MLKKFTKFFVIIVIALMILSPTVLGFTLQGWGLTPGSVGSFITASNNYGFFCMNHGYKFVSGKYRVYETGTVDQLTLNAGFDSDDGQLLSFIIGDMQRAVADGEKAQNGSNINGVSTRNGQEWQTYIWDILGYNSTTPNTADYAELKAKYEEYKAVYDVKDEDITITAPDPDVVVADENGIIGPFTVNYPYKEKIDEHIDLKITATNSTTGVENVFFDNTDKDNIINKLQNADGDPFQPGDTEFYFSVSEVNYGDKYKFSVEWSFTYYNTAQYWKLTPPRTMLIYMECIECGSLRLCKAEGWLDPNTNCYVDANGNVLVDANGEPKLSNFTVTTYWDDKIPNFSGTSIVLDTETGEELESESWVAAYDTIDEENAYEVWVYNYVNGTASGLKHRHYINYIPGTDYAEIEDDYSTRLASIQGNKVFFAELSFSDNLNQTGYYNLGGESGAQYGCQNYIFLQTTSSQVTKTAELEVLVGQPNIVLSLDKVNALTKLQLADVGFEINVENGSVVVGTSTENPYKFTTNGSTQLIEIKPDNSQGLVDYMTMRFTETSTADPDDYLQYLSDLVITVTWNAQSSQWELTNLEVPDFENASFTLGAEKNTWTITAENRPKIELSGFVWIDEPEGEKQIDPPNGYYDRGEESKSGVEVYLYKSDGTWIQEDGYGNLYGDDGYLVTDSNGEYLFENIPKLSDGESYYILFRYDGINYIRTVNGQSEATEKDRASFNARFKTISAGQSNDGTTLEYDYDGRGTSVLITEDRTGKVLDEFAISADTLRTTYNETTNGIDLGLRKKVVDLSLMTDLYTASATINGVPVEYTYNDTFDVSGTINSVLNISQDITAGTKNYTMDLYKSDYTYRIGDYLGGSSDLSHQPTLDTSEQEALQDSREELQVLLDYVVLLNNQSVTEAQVEELIYYYDSHLTPVSITGGQAIDTGSELIITPDSPNLAYGEQTRITIQFKYDVSSTEEQPTITNYAEITRYSTTDGGYVDCDSAPGNVFEGGSFKYEDDADQANGLKINIASTEREISGYVYEDNKTSVDDNSGYTTGNGEYDAGETRIDDVIVQLIEIKTLNIGGTTHRLEYIWQETTTGSNVVRAISADGTSIGTYTVPAETGKYTFKGFIPGDYIVRFIYGDGTYYDSALNENNILKYNGQDYKSTVDKLYTVGWLTIGTDGYSEHDSMARDIESRRLEVMKYALSTDSDNLVINSKEKLTNTWMAADTSKLGVSDSMIAQSSSSYVRQGVDFGLVKRPETSISLVKHITSLSLTGTNFNVSASMDISAYSEDSTEIMSELNKSSENGGSLTAMATTRGNRGYWQIESNNIEGTTLKLEYTYRVKNIGEPEFLRSDLANKFSVTDGLDNYLNAITDRINVVNSAIKTNSYKIADSYLGTAYYTGVRSGNDTEIGAWIQLEDYLANDLTFNESSTTDFMKTSDQETKDILDIAGNEAEEDVKVIRTRYGALITAGQGTDFKLQLTKTLSASDTLEFPSYIAQVVSPDVNLAGTRITGTTANNLKYVQAYADMATLDNLDTETDEYWAETFRIVPTTGEDKQSSFALIISITSGLAIIVVGIVLIRKFIIKY